ncbi:adenylate/guanylate cyclase domain-containing protein [Nocardioides sp. WS12]|nr:adenylate/guanylate cyclase domain-containing protein [Nocardioides sp. WS12]
MIWPQHTPRSTRLFGLRFAQRETERDYQRWRVSYTTPFARIGYIGSTPSWVLLLVAVVVLDPDAADQAAFWVVGWIVLLVVLTGLTFHPALQRMVTPLSAAANCLAGFLIVWLLSEVTLADEASQSRAGVMTAGLIVVMFFGFAVFRNPPGAATVAITPYVAFGSYQLLEAYNDGELNAVEASSFAAAQWIAFLGCLLVCIVTEIVDRRTFSKDQIIAAQQQELRSTRETIRRYVPRPVFEHVARGETAEIDVPVRRRLTVLFADLVGFTALADRVEPEDLTQVINDYMTAMSQLIDEHGGIVNEFAGDGLMALFGAPDEMDVDQQVASAVRAAHAMHTRLDSLNRHWQGLGIAEPMQTRIGIDTGMLSVGSFGSAGRMTYTAIGMHTNIAARLQAACDPGQILISEASWYLVRDHAPCEPRGEVHCKGVHYPVRSYSPISAFTSTRPDDQVV